MCNPVAIAAVGLAISVATTTYAYYDQNQTVKAQNKINQQQADEGAALANKAYQDQAGELRARQAQEAEAASQAKEENAKKAAAARETVRVSSGEAGVAGVSVDNLIQDYYRQEAVYNSSVDRNLAIGAAQTDAELRGMRSGAYDRSIAMKRPAINPPSYLVPALQIAGQGLDAYNRYRYTTATPSGRTTG